VNNNPEERPAIIAKRGKKSGLSISKSPCLSQHKPAGEIISTLQVYNTLRIHLKGFITMVGCSIRGVVHNLFCCLLFSDIKRLHAASLLLCRNHTNIFEYYIQLNACCRRLYLIITACYAKVEENILYRHWFCKEYL
jgi:hypothetical protein